MQTEDGGWKVAVTTLSNERASIAGGSGISDPDRLIALARDLGLTKATTSALVTDLLERDLVEEQEVGPRGRVGRPAVDVAAAAWSVGVRNTCDTTCWSA